MSGTESGLAVFFKWIVFRSGSVTANVRRPDTRVPVMLEKYELGRWFHQAFGFKLFYLPYAALPLLVGSLALPFLGWWFKRLRLISARAQRIAEIAWLVLLALVFAIGWGMWAIDYCDRISSDRVTPFAYGIFAGISIGVLSVFGIREWRIKKCLAGKPLGLTLLIIAGHSALFYVYLMVVGIIGLLLTIPRDAPLAALFLPDWIGQLFLLVAFGLYILSVVWVIPAAHRRWIEREGPASTSESALDPFGDAASQTE